MLINKRTLSYITRNDKPNENWIGDDYYLVEDGTELANKIIQYYPRCNYSIVNGEIVDVTYIEKTQEELNEERVEEIKQELVKLDSTINRATEDLYELTDTTPYTTIQDVINQKETLREELRELQGGETVEGDN